MRTPHKGVFVSFGWYVWPNIEQCSIRFGNVRRVFNRLHPIRVGVIEVVTDLDQI